MYFRNFPLLADYDPRLNNIVSRETFLELGHLVLNFTVEKSDGYLKITTDKAKNNVFDCPADYPLRPLAVFYGLSDNEKKWYAGESRNFYPEPFLTQAMIPDADGVDQLIEVYFHAIIFY